MLWGTSRGSSFPVCILEPKLAGTDSRAWPTSRAGGVAVPVSRASGAGPFGNQFLKNPLKFLRVI